MTPASTKVAPAPTSPAAKKPVASRKPLYLAAGGGAALVLVIVLSVMYVRSGGPPPLNAPADKLVKYALSDDFGKLIFDKQVQYLVELEDRQDNNELKKAYEERKLNDVQFGNAKALARVGRDLGRLNRFKAMPTSAERQAYVNALADKKLKDDGGKDGDSSHLPEAAKRNKALEKAKLAALPADVRKQLKDFENLVDDAEKARKPPTTKPAKG